jgi:hypothetical protein
MMVVDVLPLTDLGMASAELGEPRPLDHVAEGNVEVS